jgi:transglutaminase-like putative cysteine protease
MPRLSIRHETRYEYERPVSFGQHRLLVRPRDGHSLRLIDASLELSPPGITRWTYDALGNCVCWFQPSGPAPMLKVVNCLTLERYPAPIAPVDDPHSTFPVIYDQADRLVLSAFTLPVEEDPDGVLVTWVRRLIGSPAEPVLSFIQRMNQTIHDEMIYGERGEPGAQSPARTVRERRGSCRDFAWLMVEGLRSLGFAARFVTGYLYDPAAGGGAVRGSHATHAWCEVFLPSWGWTEFDPTNGLTESADLIPVAIARMPSEAAPVSGTLVGDPGQRQLHVDVDVRLIEGGDAQAQAA